MKDISDWSFVGYGVDSTLEKHDLLSPERFPDENEGHRRYIIKYPRKFALGVSWEDVTELFASQIGKIMKLKMMEVEIVVREGRRGALLKNFVPYKGQFIEGGTILSEFDEYNNELLGAEKKDLILAGFKMIEKLSFWDNIKREYIAMNFFDILIGNQDRHPFNWMMLYYEDGERKFSPIYDNGASLGFRFDDATLDLYLREQTKIHKYIRQTRVKAGLFEKKKFKAQDIIEVMKNRYSQESEEIITKIDKFNFQSYNNYIEKNLYLSENQKDWLKLIISLRREYILKWYEGE